MKYYIGEVSAQRDWSVRVEEDGVPKPLDPGFSMVNHSPSGFAWGYGGSGPAQLAFAILADLYGGNSPTARKFYQDFKWKVIADLPQDDGFRMSEDYIRGVVKEIEREQ